MSQLIGSRFLIRDFEPISGAPVSESWLSVTALSTHAAEFNDGSLVVSLDDGRWRKGSPVGATLAGLRVSDLTPGMRTKALFQPAADQGEAVPVNLTVKGFEVLKAREGTARAIRVEVTGHASHNVPIQTPGSYRGAEMQGTLVIEMYTGLILSAHIRCAYPSYAMHRDLVNVTSRTRSEGI